MTPTLVYGAYGDTVTFLHVARVAFAGEVTERDTGWYLLGNRMYNPVLRRFLAPDQESPFSDGGFNRYVYCSGDPVNRIDPTGNAWTDWLMAGLGLGLAILGTAFSLGAASPALGAAATAVASAASGSLTAASIAPATVATVTAATMDVISLGASIGSVASMATRDQKASSIFGWIGMATGIASAGAAVTAARQGGFGMARSATAGKVATRRASTSSSGSVSSATTPAASSSASASVRTPARALAATATAGGVTRASIASGPAGASGGNQRRTPSLVTNNATATRPQLQRTFSAVGAEGGRETSLYAGTRPPQRARQNPHARTDGAGPGAYRDDLTGAVRAGASAGVKVTATDVTTLTKEQIKRRLSDDGVHVVNAPRGLVDQATLTSLNMQDMVSDHLVSVPAAP
jgi:RHS repeat-associated protein